MVKKALCLIVACIALLSIAMAEDYDYEEYEILFENGGIDFRLRGYVDGVLAYESIFLDPHDGPGYEYQPVSCDLPKGAVVQVLTQATDPEGNRWVLVDAGNIRFYLIQQDRNGKVMLNCDLSDVPAEPTALQIMFNSSWECQLYDDATLKLGPGPNYQSGKYTAMCGEEGHVILMNGDWALVEFGEEVIKDEAGSYSAICSIDTSSFPHKNVYLPDWRNIK